MRLTGRFYLHFLLEMLRFSFSGFNVTRKDGDSLGRISNSFAKLFFCRVLLKGPSLRGFGRLLRIDCLAHSSFVARPRLETWYVFVPEQIVNPDVPWENEFLMCVVEFVSFNWEQQCQRRRSEFYKILGNAARDHCRFNINF